MLRRPRLILGALTTLALAGTLVMAATSSGVNAEQATAADPLKSVTGEYLVLFEKGERAAAIKAIARSGAQIVRENKAIGTALVKTAKPEAIEELAQSEAVEGVAPNKSIGHAPKKRVAKPTKRHDEDMTGLETTTRSPMKPAKQKKGKADPLAHLQWDKKMIGATVNGSYRKDRGNHGVRVGIIDTGVDGSHPDIKANFDKERSRNFTVDIPEVNGVEVDGPCEFDGCADPADWDDNSHGTHVAGIVGSPLNGIGTAGVAPDVSLVNLRAGQDSGYFFLAPTLDAISHAGDAGVDVANMSFFIDPWEFNCADNPADSPMERLEQRTTVTATQRAIDYARSKGVTFVSSLGNGFIDLGKREIDTGSPNFPPNEDGDGVNARERQIDTSCLNMPTEADGVISVTALGISKRKSYFSSFGIGFADISAPGGDAFDTPDNRLDVTKAVLSPVPENWVRDNDLVDEDGNPVTPSVVRDCQDDVCAYYGYKQGTSMSGPNAAGVAALLVSRFGRPGGDGLTLNPKRTERLLYRTSTKTACPRPRDFTYTLVRDSGTEEFTHRCEGNRRANGFYGRGIVNANRAAR